MSLEAGPLGQQADLEAEFLACANEKCAIGCQFANAKAKKGALMVLSGTPKEVAMKLYSNAVEGCSGPGDFKMCDAEKEQPTFKCDRLDKLMVLTFQESL